MKEIVLLILSLAFVSGCEKSSIEKTPEMEKEARDTVLTYLTKNKLPAESLISFKSSAQPKPDFAYLYTGGGRCIEFIVNCHAGGCTDLGKYPYDEHGDPCP